jgi:membrane protein YdbS with pleckstrin-like domain
LPYCSNCGSEVLERDNFCMSCGGRLHRTEPKPADELRKKTVVEAEPEAPQAPDIKDYGRYGPNAFPKQVLTDGEVPLYETRPLLWITLMGPAVLILFGLAVLIAAYVGLHSTVVLYILGLLLVSGMLWVFHRWLRWRYTIYAATNRRVLCQTGVISKSYVDCPLGKVQTVYVQISAFGRMNNFGTVRVATAGEARVEIEWRDVKSPTKAQRILNEIIDKHTHGTG